ncbi:MAG TPA: pyruvate kinase, partial [Enteractinococcus sp.]
DVDGRVLEPALVAFGEVDREDVTPLPLADHDQRIISRLQVGDTLRLTDARDSNRRLRVEEVSERGVVVSARKTIYWATGTEIHTEHGALVVGELPEVEQSMRVHVGDEIVLTRSMEPRPAVTESPFVIGCSLTDPFDTIATGDRVLFDDGKIATIVTEHNSDEIRVTVEEAAPNGTKLKAGKGINFPDTDLGVAALTEEDLSHIPFVAQYADMVNMSFVHGPQDVAELMETLTAHDGEHIDITLKIETVEAFEQLPRMLLEAMRWDTIGVMIARGDLAVEAGFARMAELQEEILWLCEAAHVPAIWATQVLENLAKTGLPSRAEITDAAKAQRAESVMLNKGPFITDAITKLSDILHRMGSHADKKRDMLRELRSWKL